MMPGTLSIITNAFPAGERGKAIGIWAGVSAIALALGPLLGGWLTEDVSWRAIFFLNLPVAVGAIVVTLFAAEESRDETVSRRSRLPRHRRADRRPHRARARPRRGQLVGLGLARILGLFALSVVALIGFVQIEKRLARRRSSTSSFFRSRQFVGATSVAFMVTFAMFAMFFFLALYMQNILGYSPARDRRALPPHDAADHGRRPDLRAAVGPCRPALR